MNRKQFDRALEGISDDFIDAAAGAYEQKGNRKKMFIRVACAACAVLVLTVAGLLWWAPTGVTDPTQPTISMENPTTPPTTQPEATEPAQPETTEPKQEEIVVNTGNVFFLTATENNLELAPMQVNVTLPLDREIRIIDLSNLSDQEKYFATMEADDYKHEFRKKYSKLLGEFNGQEYRSKKLIIQELSGGVASLIIRNNSEIESIERETTGVLGVGESYSVHNEEYTHGEEPYQVTIPANSTRIYLECVMTYETISLFVQDPTTPLSTISDTVTITIHYKNGTKEIVMIDVTVDDDGRVYMTQRGNNTGV